MKPTALVVDDHPENAYLLSSLLGGHGYEVVTVANGREALACARRAIPDVIVSDILMPVMDGFTLCRECKSDPQLAGVPFVFYTATYTDPKDEQLALSLGADLFLVKPTEPDTLIEAISSVLQRRRRGIVPPRPAPPPETTYLKEYNEALVRKLERKLAQLEEANRALALRGAVIDSSVSGVALADHDGRITYANPSLARILGLPGGGLEGRRLAELVADEPSRTAVARALAAGSSWLGDVRTQRPDATPVVLHALFEAVRDADGNPLCLMLSCTDATELTRTREQLQRTQRLESLGILSRSIAHDVNNLLMGLLGNVELGVRALPSDSPARKYLDVALGAWERARNLTQRLQTFAKGGSMERRRTDLREILLECGSLSLSGSNARMELEAPPDLRPVDADPNQLCQVFNNLLINARQAMHADGGTVVLRARNRTLGKDGRPGLQPGEYVEVSVSDQGPGIPEEIAPRIFDPFFTTKPGGTGLGLATSYWIVKDHGGEISLAAPGCKGATLVVLLPVAAQRTAPPAPAVETDLGGQGRVLLMDDEPIVRETTRRMLTLAGYEAVAVDAADAALEAWRQAAREGRPFDLALLDLTVRGGAGGLETLKMLRCEDGDAVVILSSGYNDDATVAQAAQAGCAAFIQKPYRRHELLSLVKAAVARPR